MKLKIAYGVVFGHFAIGLALAVMTSCSSVKKYERMPTVDEKMAQQDQRIENGMMITRKGAVLDIQVEEVQEQKRKLEARNAELEVALKNLNEDLRAKDDMIRTLRAELGLPAEPPKAKTECCDGSGNLISHQPAPSLHEELIFRRPAHSVQH